MSVCVFEIIIAYKYIFSQNVYEITQISRKAVTTEGKTA
jgi:hypothetical protein